MSKQSSSIDLIFLEALKYFASKYETQKQFSKTINLTSAYLNDLLCERRKGEDNTKRAIAAALGFPDRYYEDFLDIGRAALALKEGQKFDPLKNNSSNELLKRGFFAVDFSESLKLDPIEDIIPVTLDKESSNIIVHQSSIDFYHSQQSLQAFISPHKDMEPTISVNSCVIVDKSFTKNNIITADPSEKNIYLVCFDKASRRAVFRFVTFDGDSFILEADNKIWPLKRRAVDEFILLGKAIYVTTYLK
ncbi:MAG: hypothetical protein LBS60_04865 [Deltaproteobacteria bacterium]|nr:hypothetical protein [Deltaproteobacteria bacterium]